MSQHHEEIIFPRIGQIVLQFKFGGEGDERYVEILNIGGGRIQHRHLTTGEIGYDSIDSFRPLSSIEELIAQALNRDDTEDAKFLRLMEQVIREITL